MPKKNCYVYCGGYEREEGTGVKRRVHREIRRKSREERREIAEGTAARNKTKFMHRAA